MQKNEKPVSAIINRDQKLAIIFSPIVAVLIAVVILFVTDGFQILSMVDVLLIFSVSAFAGALVGDWLQNELKKE
jgi:hypothetical protein